MDNLLNKELKVKLECFKNLTQLNYSRTWTKAWGR